MEENLNLTTRIMDYVYQQCNKNIIDEYVADFLLNNKSQIYEKLLASKLATESEIETGHVEDYALFNVCRSILSESNMQYNYKGYGQSMKPISHEEALALFDKGSEVFKVYDNGTKDMINDRADIKSRRFFYATEIVKEMEKPVIEEVKLKMDLAQKEFIRVLSKAGYDYVPNANDGRDAIFKHGKEVAVIGEENMVLYYSQNRKHAEKILDIRNAVNEYVVPFQTAKNENAEVTQGYYKLLQWNSAVLCAKQMADESFQFVTWQKDKSNDGFNTGHYFVDFGEAKNDFSKRADLINHDMLFTETQLKVIHAGLVSYAELDPVMDFGKEIEVGNLIDKIEALIPELVEQKEQKQEMGEEVEHDI